MSVISFTKWSGPEGIEQFIINQTGCKPYRILRNKQSLNVLIISSVYSQFYLHFLSESHTHALRVLNRLFILFSFITLKRES